MFMQQRHNRLFCSIGFRDCFISIDSEAEKEENDALRRIFLLQEIYFARIKQETDANELASIFASP